MVLDPGVVRVLNAVDHGTSSDRDGILGGERVRT
jgi:hypothetical protein